MNIQTKMLHFQNYQIRLLVIISFILDRYKFVTTVLNKLMSHRRNNARQRRLNGPDLPLGRRNAGRRRINQSLWNQTDNNRRNLIIAAMSNIESLDTGDERRDVMLREVLGNLNSALNALDRYEMGKSLKSTCMIHN